MSITNGPVPPTNSADEIVLAHSPDSDDAFMFYGLRQDAVDTEGIRYRHELADIETLNRRALDGELAITAVSIHAYAYLADRYVLLPHGASFEYALANREAALLDAMRFSRGLTKEKTDRFVGMYVNDWTRSYGERGREAVRLFLRRAHEAGALPALVEPEWVAEER